MSQGDNSADVILIFPNKLGIGPETLSQARGPNIFQEPYFNHRILFATELVRSPRMAEWGRTLCLVFARQKGDRTFRWWSRDCVSHCNSVTHSSCKLGRISILSGSCPYLSLPPCPTVSSSSDPVSCFLLVSSSGAEGTAGAEAGWEPSTACQVCGFAVHLWWFTLPSSLPKCSS